MKSKNMYSFLTNSLGPWSDIYLTVKELVYD